MRNVFHGFPLPTSLKHLAGSAQSMRVRLFVMASIAGFALSVYVGAFSAIDSLLAARDVWYRNGQLADLELRVTADDIYNFPDFHGVAGVQDYRVRMLYPGSLRLAETGKESQRILLIATASESSDLINTQQLLSGSRLSAQDKTGVVIERSLARFNGIRVGDDLTVNLGHDQLVFRVRGIASDPEFLLAPVNPNLFIPRKGFLGVLYVNPGILKDRFGFVPANSVLFRAKPHADMEAMRQAVLERARSKLDVDYTALRTEQFSYQFLEKDLSAFRVVIPVIVAVSALSAIFVTFFLFMQWVAQEQQSLAIFLTLGHTPYSLSGSFAALFVGLAAFVAGEGLLFAGFIGRSFMYRFCGSLGLPLPPLTLTPTYLANGMVCVLLMFILAGSIVIHRIFSVCPRDAMRRGLALVYTPDRIGTALGHWLPFHWLRLPLRNLFRHRTISCVSIAAVALGFGITASFFIALRSFVGTSTDMMAQNTWNIAIDFAAPMWDEDVTALIKSNGIFDSARYARGIVQAVHRGRRINLYVGAFEPAKHWQWMRRLRGAGLSQSDPTGILLEQSTARELKLGLGDTLRVELRGRRRQAVIRGIFSGALPGESRFTLSFFQDLADLDQRSTGLLVRTQADIPTLTRQLLKNPDVQQVLNKADATKALLAAFGQVTEIVHLGSTISIIIASLFIFACVSYTVLQRRSEYQMLRILGFRDNYITVMMMVEVGFLGLASLLWAVPIGTLTGRYLNYKISEAWYHIDTIIGLPDFLKTFVPGLLLLPLLAWPISRTILRNSLDAELRTREIA